MSILEAQQEIVENFEFFDDWEDKYAYLISLGKGLPAYPEDKKNEEHLIKGCQSLVWLDLKLIDGKLLMVGVSDAAIVSGLIALLVAIYQGAAPAEINQTKLTFLNDIGLESHLSPTRNNGLHAMLKGIQAFAKKHAETI
jgi:cysteine desulfuration protein SufE